MNGLTYNLPELEVQLADAERKAEALRLIIDGVRTYIGEIANEPATDERTNGNGSSNGHADTPRGRAAIRRLVAESDKRTWTLKALGAELLKRGWTTSTDPERVSHALGVALSRLVRDGEAERVRMGVYRFPRPEVMAA